MPTLKLKVESILHRYLNEELTDEGFKESIQAILDEFKGKNMLHQNIGQLTWRIEIDARAPSPGNGDFEKGIHIKLIE